LKRGLPVRALRAVVLYATAAAGLVGGHLLGYLAVAPDPGRRSFLLAGSGHAYLSKAVVLAAAAAILAATAAAALGAARVHGRTRPGAPGGRSVGMRLAGLQVLGFIALEVGERVMAGASLEDLATVFGLGVPLQVLVAALGALVLSAVARAAEAVARVLAGPAPVARSASVGLSEPGAPWIPSAIISTPRLSRGPPSLRTA
jgi:hypothetical protein